MIGVIVTTSTVGGRPDLGDWDSVESAGVFIASRSPNECIAVTFLGTRPGQGDVYGGTATEGAFASLRAQLGPSACRRSPEAASDEGLRGFLRSLQRGGVRSIAGLRELGPGGRVVGWEAPCVVSGHDPISVGLPAGTRPEDIEVENDIL